MYELDADSRIERTGEGAYRATLTDRWNIGPFPNGGYLAFVAVRALHEVLPHPDPLTVTTHYLRPPVPGEVELAVEPVRVGRGTSTGAVSMRQNGEEVLRTTGILTDLGGLDGETLVDAQPPAMPPPEACEGRSGTERGLPTFVERFDTRFAPGTASWLSGERSGRAEIGGWARFADGRPVDTDSLVLMADAYPPPIFNAVAAGWVPTLELTVHVRRRPADGPLRCWFRTRFLIGGYLEEDGEIWDVQDRLVAQSRQLARLQRPR